MKFIASLLLAFLISYIHVLQRYPIFIGKHESPAVLGTAAVSPPCMYLPPVFDLSALNHTSRSRMAWNSWRLPTYRKEDS